MANPPITNPYSRLPRIGDLKESAIPNDTDHNGWLLCQDDVRMVSKTMYPRLFAKLGTLYGESGDKKSFGLPPYGAVSRIGAGAAFKLGDKGGNRKIKITKEQLPATDIQKVTISPSADAKILIGQLLGLTLTPLPLPPVVKDGSVKLGSGTDVDITNPFGVSNVFIYAGMPVTT